MRKFYLQPDNKDIQTYEFTASEDRQYDDDIEVVETAEIKKEIGALRDDLIHCSILSNRDPWTTAREALTRADKLIKELEG